jgi:hypothetical protein
MTVVTVFRQGWLAMAMTAIRAALFTVNNLIALFNINNKNITSVESLASDLEMARTVFGNNT